MTPGRTEAADDTQRRELAAFPDELERQHDRIGTLYAFRYRCLLYTSPSPRD